jgi:crotonobetainyl-CoA:carnitine CoA-transferase CaiB-like acyl-CoA transferase
MGNAHFNIAPYEVFQARDRWFVLGAANARQWEMLCEVIGRPDIKADSRFATNQDRLANRTALQEVLNEAFATRDAQEWVDRLQEGGIPSGPINSIRDVFNHPQAQERQLKIDLEHPTAGKMSFPGFPYRMSKTPAQAHRPPPLLGEHTDEILQEILGYSIDEVARLHEKGAI